MIKKHKKLSALQLYTQKTLPTKGHTIDKNEEVLTAMLRSALQNAVGASADHCSVQHSVVPDCRVRMLAAAVQLH